jgi:S-(hydroxymethyl)glutathione dehydrogenase/alcohol dehydrogenase
MRAALLRRVGDPALEVRDDHELVGVGAGEVEVEIHASGVCHSDLSCMNGTIPSPAPCVLGHEGAGIISAVGEGVNSVAPGDHVIVAWSPPCGDCAFCGPRHQPHLCSNIQMVMGGTPHFLLDGQPVFGMAGTGTFAEHMIVPHQAVVKVDADIPLEVASLVGCGVMTGVGAAINTAKVTPGSSVVVVGCGGVGISCIQGAKIAGASVILAVDVAPGKHEEALRFGATHACTPDEVDSLKATLTGGDGFDFGLEAIGLPATMRATYDAVRRGGTACIVGVGKLDQLVSFSAFELFFSEKTLVGSYYGSADVRSDFHKLLGFWRDGQLDLEGMISRRITLDEINDAFAAMQRGEVIRQVISFSGA